MKDIEEELYARLCKYCPNQKMCHEECEHCEEYNEVLENENRRSN